MSVISIIQGPNLDIISDSLLLIKIPPLIIQKSNYSERLRTLTIQMTGSWQKDMEKHLPWHPSMILIPF